MQTEGQFFTWQHLFGNKHPRSEQLKDLDLDSVLYFVRYTTKFPWSNFLKITDEKETIILQRSKSSLQTAFVSSRCGKHFAFEIDSRPLKICQTELFFVNNVQNVYVHFQLLDVLKTKANQSIITQSWVDFYTRALQETGDI